MKRAGYQEYKIEESFPSIAQRKKMRKQCLRYMENRLRNHIWREQRHCWSRNIQQIMAEIFPELKKNWDLLTKKAHKVQSTINKAMETI